MDELVRRCDRSKEMDSSTGRTACHSASLLATPRHTDGLLRSVGFATYPGMKLYKKPFLNIARRGGARLWLARIACDSISPIHIVLLTFVNLSGRHGRWYLTFTVDEDIGTISIYPQ